MPLYPPRSQEPYKKKERLFKREQPLRHALSSGFASVKVSRAAENVRAAQRMILKAEQELIRYDSETEDRTRQLAAIEKKRNTTATCSSEGIGQGSYLVLTPELYESVLERSAPLSTVAIRQLRKSPMDLDVYAWPVHRRFNLRKPSTLSWEQLLGQIGHSYTEVRYFRRFIADSLQRVLRASRGVVDVR